MCFACQIARFLRSGQPFGHVVEVLAEVLRVDVFYALAQRVQLVAGGAGRCRELVHGFVVVVAQLCQILPGLDDRLARCHSDAAHGSTDGNGLPVYFVEVSRDVVHRLPECHLLLYFLKLFRGIEAALSRCRLASSAAS